MKKLWTALCVAPLLLASAAALAQARSGREAAVQLPFVTGICLAAGRRAG